MIAPTTRPRAGPPRSRRSDPAAGVEAQVGAPPTLSPIEPTLNVAHLPRVQPLDAHGNPQPGLPTLIGVLCQSNPTTPSITVLEQ